jgi:hypothetical protein
VYDVFILCVMAMGISTVVVFSYKIFRSRVYPVGIVRTVPAPKQCADETFAAELDDLQKDFQTKITLLMGDDLSPKDVTDWLNTTWRPKSQSGKQPYKLAVRHHSGQNPSREREDSALEEEIIEHGEALKLHTKQFEEIEKRIRQLETESVQKLQEAREEKHPVLLAGSGVTWNDWDLVN